tara:strand:- start:127 stop:309 length:183 start_codon:yes stop_codon:yes gene_type:complete
MSNVSSDDDLRDIKKLMILGLARSGLTSSQIGDALELDRTTVARMFPPGLLTEVRKGGME